MNTARPNPSTRRGSIYVAVLSTAMLVTIIGVSALLAVRVEQWAGSMTEAAAKADSYSQSVLDLAQFWIAADPNWRSNYTSDSWSAAQTDGPVTYQFKLADELDGNLANDPNHPVCLYGKAAVGDAVRIYSVLLQPPRTNNLLANGDIESGTTAWSGLGQCVVSADTGSPHGGTTALAVRSRSSSSAGANQDVTNRLASGVTYRAEAWMRMRSGSSQAFIALYTKSAGSGVLYYWFYGSPNVGTTWTNVSGTLTPTWSGTLLEARWIIATSGGTVDFYIDDALLANDTSGSSPVPVTGSRRRELQTTEAPPKGSL